MSNTSIHLRPAKDTDGSAIAKLIQDIFAEYTDCPYVPGEFPELRTPASHYTHQSGQLFVALNYQDELIGCFAIVPTEQAGWFEFFKVYLARSARGAGTAQALYEKALSWADAQSSLRGIKLWTDIRFASGHRFYEKLGFERVPVVRFLNDAGKSWEYHYRKTFP